MLRGSQVFFLFSKIIISLRNCYHFLHRQIAPVVEMANQNILIAVLQNAIEKKVLTSAFNAMNSHVKRQTLIRTYSADGYR